MTRIEEERIDEESVDMAARFAAMQEALIWYEEQVRLCRKIGGVPDGEAARNALSKDGGIRARYALGAGARFPHGLGWNPEWKPKGEQE